MPENRNPASSDPCAEQGDDVAPVAQQHPGQHDQEGHVGHLDRGGVPGQGGVGGVVPQEQADRERHELQDRDGTDQCADVEGDATADVGCGEQPVGGETEGDAADGREQHLHRGAGGDVAALGSCRVSRRTARRARTQSGAAR